MDKRYKHLGSEERGVISAEHRRGSGLGEIGLVLGRAPSTIGRELAQELARGGSGEAGYSPQVARAIYDLRRSRCRPRAKLAEGAALHDWVRRKLVHQRWSPEQIAARLRAMHPDDPTARVSHETIYAAIYAQPKGALKAAMVLALRQAKPARGFRRTTVGTLVERKTRFVVLCKMEGNTAAAALEAFSRQMKRLPREMRRSMTYDRGSEMACHPELARRLKIDIWFCDPHAPWQRGSNENTNGLLRQFMPKGTDLSDASQTWLNDVARLMNGRPRKTLGWKTPAEAMAEEIKTFSSTVALDV